MLVSLTMCVYFITKILQSLNSYKIYSLCKNKKWNAVFVCSSPHLWLFLYLKAISCLEIFQWMSGKQSWHDRLKYSTRINQVFEYYFFHLIVQCPVILVLYPGYLGCYIDKKRMTVKTAFTVRVNSVLCPCRVTLSCHSSLSGVFALFLLLNHFD